MTENTIIRQAKIVSIAGLIFILITTLFPFRFTFSIDPQPVSLKHLVCDLVGNGVWQEPAANILLFIPLGFGVAGLMYQRRRPLFIFITTFGVGFILSTIVEFLQLFVLVRTTSIADLVTNSLGAICGYLLFHFFGIRFLQRVIIFKKQILPKLPFALIMTLCMAYIIGISVLWRNWQHNVSLLNWDMTFPLLLGNEKTGNRPWNGTVSKLYFGDYVLPDKDISHTFDQGMPPLDTLLAHYQLNAENEIFFDQLGHLPDLTRKGREQQEQSFTGLSGLWLADFQTDFLNNQLKTTSQFTIGVIVQTANTQQTGPARIISNSINTLERNFMLGQEGNDLIFRLRTPTTGENGSRPSLIIPDVFTDTLPHHLIITYDGHLIRIYLDNIQQMVSFDLTEVAVARQLFFISYSAPVALPVSQIGYLFFRYGLFIGFPLVLLWGWQKTAYTG